MLPETGGILKQDFKIKVQPSKTFKLNLEGNCLGGITDGLEAVKQTVYCILSTERYDYIIHSWNYGVELKKLFGKPISVVKSKIKKRIKEALMQDNRIQSVDAFLFEEEGSRLLVKFTVGTMLGDFTAEKEVEV